MMTRNFTMREKILLLIFAVLLVFALYYLLVFTPAMDTRTAALNDIAEIEAGMIVEEAKAKKIKTMQDALIKAGYTGEASTITPAFDNFQNLLDELNKSLSTADNYKLNFLAPKMDESIVSRDLQLVFYSGNYAEAVNIIEKLYSGPYRCDITSFKLTPKSKDFTDLTVSPITATLKITYYELNK